MTQLEHHELQVSVRELRAQLGPILDRVEAGQQVMVTRYNERIAVLMPDTSYQIEQKKNRYPLRGTLLWQSDDFNDPMDDLWEALQ